MKVWKNSVIRIVGKYGQVFERPVISVWHEGVRVAMGGEKFTWFHPKTGSYKSLTGEKSIYEDFQIDAEQLPIQCEHRETEQEFLGENLRTDRCLWCHMCKEWENVK